MRTHYEVLGVSENANLSTIRTTYLRLLQIYHPDHNGDPVAHQKTAEIIEAYSVLSDAQTRAEYDRSLNHTSRETEPEQKTKSNERAVGQVICDKCGAQNASLRISLMYWVASLLIITRRGGRAGLWCDRCRAKQAAIWSFEAGVFGWWGFPWGPIYTTQALFYNARGGKQEIPRNAALLRMVSFQLYEKGQLQEALKAADASINLEKDEATIKFADFLRTMPGSYAPSRFPFLQVATTLPSIVITLVIALLIVRFINQPSGYEARYTPATPVTSAANPVSAGVKSARDRVNSLVDQLAESVKANATPAGSHHEGTKTINEYTLDRSKYQPDEFSRIASNIEPFLGDASANSDGFVSSAYFNAKLMALSIAILNDFDGGRNIMVQVRQVDELGRDDRIQPWLSSSKYVTDFQALQVQLKYMVKQQQVGIARDVRRIELKSLANDIEAAKLKIAEARTNKSDEDEHAWVTKHNHDVDLYNSLLATDKRSHIAHSKVDLAFNRCFDPAILMSKFEDVDLTSHAASVDSMPIN